MRPVDILKQHPAPWTDHTFEGGIIRVFDARGAEVGLFSMLAFALGVANATVKPQEQPAPAATGA